MKLKLLVLLKNAKNWVSKYMDSSWADREVELYFRKDNNESNKK